MMISEELTTNLTTTAENVRRVYDAGYEKGKAEGDAEGKAESYAEGKAEGYAEGKAEYLPIYDKFWDDFQENGQRTNYYGAFAKDSGFTDANYNPKYPIVCSGDENAAKNMFYNNSEITDTKVLIDVSAVPGGNSLYFAFQCPRTNLKTIHELRVSETTNLSDVFNTCYKLENITISGTIGKNVSFWGSNVLTRASILSVVGALSDTATGKNATFNKYAIANAFTDEEWVALQATKPNWQFVVYDPDEEE